jgi:hypothetical protein
MSAIGCVEAKGNHHKSLVIDAAGLATIGSQCSQFDGWINMAKEKQALL